MFDIGMSELLVVGVVALIVVGPKDLPGMFRTLGRFTAKARAMGREFSRAMEAAADESGIKDAGNALKAASNPKKFGLEALDDAADRFEKWDPMASDKSEPPTPELDPERAEAARKIAESAARKATERKARERAEAELAQMAASAGSKKAEADAADTPAQPSGAKAKTAKPKSETAKSGTAKRSAAKKPAAKKPAAKATTKPAPKSASKAATKKPAAKTAKAPAKAKKGEA